MIFIIFIILDQSDPKNNTNLLKNVDCNLKLLKFFIFLFNFQEKHPFNSSPSTADDKTQVNRTIVQVYIKYIN